MENRRFEELISSLLKRSRDKRVNWQATASSNEFIVYFENFALSISHQTQEHESSEVGIRVLDEEGQHLYSFWYDEDDDRYGEVYELFQLAYNKASRLDESLDAILSELNSEGEIGRKFSKREVDYGPEPEDDDIPF